MHRFSRPRRLARRIQNLHHDDVGIERGQVAFGVDCPRSTAAR